LTHLLLPTLTLLQKPLNQLAIHEPKRFLGFSFLVFEGAVGRVVYVAESFDGLGDAGLEGGEEGGVGGAYQ
jgi:hypothetical protein